MPIAATAAAGAGGPEGAAAGAGAGGAPAGAPPGAGAGGARAWTFIRAAMAALAAAIGPRAPHTGSQAPEPIWYLRQARLRNSPLTCRTHAAMLTCLDLCDERS